MNSNAPIADLGQHVEAIEPPRVDASTFRQGWRVRTRLDTLLADDRITPGQWQAAVEYRDAWARVLQAGGGSSEGYRVSGGTDAHHRILGLLATVTRLRVVHAAIGADFATLCFACAVEDRSWASIAATWSVNPETCRDRTARAVRALAVAWAEARRSDPAVSSPPRHAPRPVRASWRPPEGGGESGTRRVEPIDPPSPRRLNGTGP
jgi:hypothetical protein